MHNDADAKMILMAPPPDNWKKPHGWSQSLQPHIVRSSRPT